MGHCREARERQSYIMRMKISGSRHFQRYSRDRLVNIRLHVIQTHGISQCFSRKISILRLEQTASTEVGEELRARSFDRVFELGKQPDIVLDEVEA